VHDRRIDGKAHTFGNYGTLYMNAMTWYDHETQSIWSQPTGVGLVGHYEGVRLEMVPVSVIPWGTWKREHPDTLLLNVGSLRFAAANPFTGGGRDYVVGVAIGDDAKAFSFRAVSDKIVHNDYIGDLPVVVYANPKDRDVRVFVRSVWGQVLEFVWENDRLKDESTDTLWSPVNGLALEGPLRGELLKELPYSTAFDWAWEDFYPHTDFFPGS
jgi:hypothetical protein